ncbi:hypothetical protein P879_03056 [Paragonimus westermani]|uniref:Leucine-rich repeat-containing protein 63 n=1 Tax=Paragonimus westermani TaxID=34504 RepID=A0A8T0DQ54_9TREM|nr:hypothetical protein P879_03056 [Paragonimus westermani]
MELNLILLRKPRRNPPTNKNLNRLREAVKALKDELTPQKCSKQTRQCFKNNIRLKYLQQTQKDKTTTLVQNAFLTKLPEKASSETILCTEHELSSTYESKQNYFQSGLKLPPRLAALQIKPGESIPTPEKRVPLRQSLIEIAHEVQVALVKATESKVACYIRQLPRFDPAVPLKCGERYEDLPGELEFLQRLEVLILRNNPLRQIPAPVCELRRLRKLVVSYCLLNGAGYKKLRILNLRGNDLIGISPGLLNLSRLDLFDLQLQDNPLLSLLPGEWKEKPDQLQSLQDCSAMKLFMFAKQLRSITSEETPKSSKQIHSEYQLEEAQTISTYLDSVLEK